MSADRQLVSMLIKEKVENLEKSQQLVDEEVKELQRQLAEVLDNLTAKKGISKRKMKMMLSSAVSLLSFTCGYRSNLASSLQNIPWPLVVGAGSLTYALYCLKLVLSSAQQVSKEQLLAEYLLYLSLPPVCETPRSDATGEIGDRSRLSLRVPPELFSKLLKEERGVLTILDGVRTS